MPPDPPVAADGVPNGSPALTSCLSGPAVTLPDEPARPALRYHGAKWRLAPWILSHFPGHDRYVEPYGGSAAVLLRKPRSGGEVYNDLDDQVVNVFRVLQDPALAEQLRRRLVLTPYSRSEFKRAYEPATDAVDAAAKMVIRATMGFGSAGMTRRHVTGFRSRATARHAMPAAEWATWPDCVPAFVQRLRGVVIENRPALEILAQHDSLETLFYVDPPYVAATRCPRTQANGRYQQFYRHDLVDADHEQLAERLHALRGLVLLSGYPSPLYVKLYAGWEFVDTRARTDGGDARVERLWFNPACVRAQRQLSLRLKLR